MAGKHTRRALARCRLVLGPGMAEAAAITLDAVCKRFGGGPPVAAKPREFLAVVGASGSGKAEQHLLWPWHAAAEAGVALGGSAEALQAVFARLHRWVHGERPAKVDDCLFPAT